VLADSNKSDSPLPAPAGAAPAAPPPQTPATVAEDPTRFVEKKLLEGKVIEALRQVYDPEIPVNIYELGLIYEIMVGPDNSVHVKMTLTAPGCPVAGSLPGDVERRIGAIKVDEVEGQVEIMVHEGVVLRRVEDLEEGG